MAASVHKFRRRLFVRGVVEISNDYLPHKRDRFIMDEARMLEAIIASGPQGMADQFPQIAAASAVASIT